MAALLTEVAWSFRVRHARVTRFLFAIVAAVSFETMMSTSALAQASCTFGIDAACTNSGFEPGDIGAASVTGTASIYNSGFVNGFVASATFSGFNATTVNANSGSVDTIGTLTANGGDAVTINAGTVRDLTGNYPLALTLADPFLSGSVVTVTGYAGADGNAVTINSGKISGDVLTIAGYNGGSGNAVFVNSGTINPSAFSGSGPFNQGVNVGVFGIGTATAINSGTINTDVIVSNFGSGNAEFTNTGSVNGPNGVSVRSYFDGSASAFNSGRIFGSMNVVGANFGTATFTNAGLVDGSGTGGVAINMVQNDATVNSTLNFLPGSRVVGKVFLAGGVPGFPGTTVNFFTGADISSVMTFGGNTFCGCGGSSLTGTGSTVNFFGGAPFVIFGNTVAILDPTSFAVQDRNVANFSHTISSLVTGRLNNPAPMSGGSTEIGFAPSGNVAVDMARDAFAGISSLNYASNDRVLFSNPNVTAPDGTSIWAQGFVGQRIQDADAPTLRSVNNFYGGAMGVDKTIRPGLRLGAFLGAGNVKSNVALNSGDTNSDLVFGGGYGRYAMKEAFWDFALIGGHSSNAVKRTIANNLAPNGYEFAAANYNGWFISPEVAYGVRKTIWPNVTLTPTARVRYLAANFGGYQEAGATNNLTVASRTSHNFEERAEITLAQTSDPTPTQRMQISGTVGVLALQRVGNTTVNTVLLGQNLAFATPGNNDVFGIYGGAGFDWRHSAGFTVFGAAEYTAMTDSSRTMTAKGGVKVSF